MVSKRHALTLVESVLIVLFLGIFAFVAVPKLNYAIVKQRKAEAAARKIVADLHLTRNLAISEAATNNTGFELKMLGSGPYTGYEIVNSDTSATIASHTIESDVICTGDNSFTFGPLGNLQTGSNAQLTISAEAKSFTITIIYATGAIKCTKN
jgi:Tfp pilus assembly protein FimT